MKKDLTKAVICQSKMSWKIEQCQSYIIVMLVTINLQLNALHINKDFQIIQCVRPATVIK